METRAKHLRKSQTPVEKRLWLALKGHRFCQYKFRRQVILGPYIVWASGQLHLSIAVAYLNNTFWVFIEGCSYGERPANYTYQ